MKARVFGVEPCCQETPTTPCSGGAETGLERLEILDQVRVPADLPAGDYVLQFRWDCEESNQVWASCSDVTVTVSAAEKVRQPSRET